MYISLFVLWYFHSSIDKTYLNVCTHFSWRTAYILHFFSSYRISHSTNVIDRQQYAIIHPINEAQKQQKQHFSKKN